MKICANCGNENTDAMNFCLQCGTPLAANPAWTTEQPTASFSEKRVEVSPVNIEPTAVPRGFSAPPKKNGKGLYWIFGGIAGFLALMFIALAGFVGLGVLSARKAAPSPTPFKTVYNPSPQNSPLPNRSPDTSPTPQTSFTPPVLPTKKGISTVSANQNWQLSDIDVVGSEKFLTTVTGKIVVAAVKADVDSTGYDDAKSLSRRLFAQYPTGALLMRTHYADGKVSNIQPVTAKPSVGNWQNYPTEFGKLEFCVNDNAPQGNSGQFVVTVTIIEPSKANK